MGRRLPLLGISSPIPGEVVEGAGIEHVLGGNFVDDAHSGKLVDSFTTGITQNLHLFRLGINYRFDGVRRRGHSVLISHGRPQNLAERFSQRSKSPASARGALSFRTMGAPLQA